MLSRQKRLKKSLYHYGQMKVGEVIFFKAPFGPKDGWLHLGKEGYHFALGDSHVYAIRDVERKTGARFHVHYGAGFIRVTRTK